jgi:Arylsulfotransferase (ASST)
VEALRFSRRAALGVAAGIALAAPRSPGAALRALTAPESVETPSLHYATRPTWKLPALEVDRYADELAPGFVFLAPFGSSSSAGPLVLDDAGQPVWFLPLAREQAYNFHVQEYQRRPVITWYESSGDALYGGSCVLYDAEYREIKRVHGGHGYACDLHEFLITSRDTALVAVANDVPYDLTSVGGSATSILTEGIVQELDIATGEVLFEWRSLDHVAPDESYRTEVTDTGNVDYFHLNSIGVAPDGNLIVSARHTSTIYKVDRKSGAILWRLGGKRSDFTLGDGAAFNFQHDARAHEDGTLTLFDNGATDSGAGDVEPASRPLRLMLDEQARTATLEHVFAPPTPRLATAMGNLQVLPDGGVFVGWGTAGAYTEFAPDGTVRLDAQFTDGTMSYRAFRCPWTALPSTDPAVAVERSGTGFAVHASWNGATDVAYWQVRAGTRPDRLEAKATSARSGFETVVDAPAAPLLTAVALDARRREVGRSELIRIG